MIGKVPNKCAYNRHCNLKHILNNTMLQRCTESHNILTFHKRTMLKSVQVLYKGIRFNYFCFQPHGKVIKSQLPPLNAMKQAEAILASFLHYLILKLTAF